MAGQAKALPVVKVEARNVYGITKAYPANDIAEGLAFIAGTKTLAGWALKRAEQMGFTVEITTPGVKLAEIV